MSWDVTILDADGEAALADEPHDLKGGTYCVGGTRELTLNITYNYSWFYYRFLHEEEGLGWLHGRPVAYTTARLRTAVEILGVHRYKDYWAPTPGNAGYALSQLLKLAAMAPEGAEWEVS